MSGKEKYLIGNQLEINQIYYPDFGYNSPKRTKSECKNPAFADKHLHRMGIFSESYHDDGLKGHRVHQKCVNCGKKYNFDKGIKTMFIASKIADSKGIE